MRLEGFHERLAERLPTWVRGIPFLPEHGMLIGLRGGLTHRQQRFIYGFQAAAGPAVSLIFGDRLGACFGVFPVSECRVELWTSISDHARTNYPVSIVKIGRAVVSVIEQYPRLTFAQVSVSMSSDRDINYAKRIGFVDEIEFGDDLLVFERELR